MKAYDQNLAGVVLLNHGGQQLDFARSGIEVLVEVVEKLKERRGITLPKDRFQIFVDGGVTARQACDRYLEGYRLGCSSRCVSPSVGMQARKWTPLNFTSVGIGRPFLYAFSTYGVDGVDHALQILQVGYRQIVYWTISQLLTSGSSPG